MATKSGQLKLSDIKAGKLAWLVRVVALPKEAPVARSPELIRFWKRPTLNKVKFEFQRDNPPLITFVPLHNRIIPGWHVSMSAQVYGLCPPKLSDLPEERRPKYYSRFFKSKKAALRYVERINYFRDIPGLKDKTPVATPGANKVDIRSIDPMTALGPRMRLNDMDVRPFHAPIIRHSRPPLVDRTPTCECGVSRGWFEIGHVCLKCGTEIQSPNAPTKLDWEGLKEKLRAFVGDGKYVTIQATLPTAPAAWGPRGELSEADTHLFRAPIARGYADGIMGYADMIFNPISESGNPHTNPTLHFIRGKRRDPGISVPYEVTLLPNLPLSGEIVNARTLGEVEIPFPPEYMNVNLDDWFRTHNPEAYKHMGGLKTDNDPHFYKGDQLKVIDNKDEEELCEGDLAMDEIVTMMDRSSEHRSHIIVQRTNGREYQLEKSRFELFQRGGSQGVAAILEDNDFLDPASNRTEIIFDSGVRNQEVLDYLSGKISKEEAIIRGAERAKKLPSWNPDIDGAALMCYTHGQMSEEEFGKIRMRSEEGLSDEECKAMITAAQAKPGRPFRSSELY